VTALLECEDLQAGYAGHPMVEGVSLAVQPGEIVTLLGPNGAGKTTTLLSIAGEVDQYGGEVHFDGKPARGGLAQRAKRGMCLVTEERSVFMGLTVAENLRVGRCDTKYALVLFPELEPLLARKAGLLSGGEQQILTLARALARRPRILLTDELSLGLAPLVVGRLMDVLSRTAKEDGIGVLLVEQHVRQALKIADHAVILERGRMVLSGPSAEVSAQLGKIESAYLSTSSNPQSQPETGDAEALPRH
jgi:branched-chain amino acid transport system ATP-binding protein